MILKLLTLVHVVISLVGIVAGLFVLAAFLGRKAAVRGTCFFFWTTIATSVTGFFFPVQHFMPSHAVGILSLILLGLALYAWKSAGLRGAWAKVYVVGVVLSLYLNVFVGVVQSFQKIAALKALAPTQTETPFKAAQGVVLLVFIVLGIVAAIRFRPVVPAPGATAR